MLHLRDHRLVTHTALGEGNAEIWDLAVWRVDEHVADLPRERHLLADRQLRVEHRRSAGECRSVRGGVQVRRERRGDGDEPEHEAEVARTDRQVRGGAGVAVGDRQRSEHVNHQTEAGTEDGERGGEVDGARRRQQRERHQASREQRHTPAQGR